MGVVVLFQPCVNDNLCLFDGVESFSIEDIRTVNHVKEAALAGANVATIPPSTLKALVKHPLTDKGLEAFMADWEKTGRGLFEGENEND